MPPLETSVLHTLAFFNIFNHPLTKEELFDNLWEPPTMSFLNFVMTLNQMKTQNLIAETNGFYHLPTQNRCPLERLQKGKIWETKMAIAKRAGRIVRFVPFLRAMFVCNTVASGTFNESSDIDVFIVVKKGRIWISRMIITILLSIFRLRRHGKKIADRICLSFFVADDSMDLSKIAISQEDVYLVYWLNHLIPVYDPDNLSNGIKEANSWTKKYTPNLPHGCAVLSRYAVTDSRISKIIKNFFAIAWAGAYGDLIERNAKNSQLTYMRRRSQNPEQNGKGVIVSDAMLKFHENDRRQFYYDQWKHTCVQFK